jgi:hypothetical protein
LWPFFAVCTLNRPSWSGLNRSGFNRTNGVIALCVIDVLVIMMLLPKDWIQAISKIGAIGICMVLFVIHAVWLNEARGDNLRRRWEGVPDRTRFLIRDISATFCGAVVLLFLVTTRTPTSHFVRSMNCGNSSEVTAASCN